VISRDFLTYGRLQHICPNCEYPEDIKRRCRHCQYEYPLPSPGAQALKLAMALPVGAALVLTALLVVTVFLKYVFFPGLDFIVRI
jgi:hypothetical protein